LMNPEERNRDADGEHTIESSVGLSKSENWEVVLRGKKLDGEWINSSTGSRKREDISFASWYFSRNDITIPSLKWTNERKKELFFRLRKFKKGNDDEDEDDKKFWGEAREVEILLKRVLKTEKPFTLTKLSTRSSKL
jgi:hypothetical protein